MMNNKYRNAISDYWEMCISFMSALISAYDTGTRFLQLGWITDEKLTPIGILLFLLFGCLTIIKFAKKSRNNEQLAKDAIEKMVVAENYFKELQIAYANQQKEFDALKIKVETANGSLIAHTIHNPVVNNISSDDSKKKDELERLSKPEITFPRRWQHFDDLVIKGSEPKQIMTCIKAEGDAWFIHLVIDNITHNIAYDVDYADTNFYEPEKDNTLLHGAVFSTIKYRLGTNESGTLSRTQIEKTHEMFTISIISSGSGSEAKSTVIFDTSDINVVGFYDRIKEGLSKRFTVVKDNTSTKFINWDNIEFTSWEKRLSENEVKGGMIVKNNKTEVIENCYVEIIEIYDERGLGLYIPRQAELPRTAGWEINGKVLFGKTNIDIGKQRQLALLFEAWIMSGVTFFFVGGENGFQHNISITETYFIEIEISGMISNVSLKPKRKFITVYFDGNKIHIKNVSDEFPTNN